MADSSNASTIYVFTQQAVRRAIGNLVAHPIHEHFAGYLAILRAKRASGGRSARMADINEFHDRYLRVEGASEKAPYVRPFKSRGQGLETFNPNVAGSYAPSSLRSKGKLIDVIEVSGAGQGAKYELQEDHAVKALNRLLKDRKISATSLMVFLYRDYGFKLDHPNIASVLDLFRDEFGLRDTIPSERKVFTILFADDRASFQEGDLQPHVTATNSNG